jgi:hypothetical protein
MPGDDPGYVDDGFGISFHECTPSQGGGCQPKSCTYKETWNQQKCCCVSIFGGGCVP